MTEAERAIFVCGSGVGAAIAACKLPGVRAAICHDTYSAHQGVEHDDMNVLTLGARVIGVESAVECSLAFLGASFSGESRHRRRLDKVLAIERATIEGEA
jgi:RpiB/LacA/LacB family sugar-phosphate isomerase